jgi:hypothetical protein
MAAYHEELSKAGVFLDASGLQPSSKGWRIRYAGGKRTFVETKEQLAGFYFLEAKELNEAIWLAARIHPARVGSIEIRRFAPYGKGPGPEKRCHSPAGP